MSIFENQGPRNIAAEPGESFLRKYQAEMAQRSVNPIEAGVDQHFINVLIVLQEHIGKYSGIKGVMQS